MTVDFDLSDLTRFGNDVAAADTRLLAEGKRAVVKGAVNVKAAMRADMAASRHFAQVARSITYDVRVGNGFVEAQVGPVTAGATVGDLAHLAYFGGAHGGGGTVRDPQEALNDEAPRFEQALVDIIEGLLT